MTLLQCEVVSASTARIDRIEKLRIYAGEGVQHVWRVDPTLHALEVSTLDEAQHWTSAAAYVDSDQAGAASFDAIDLDLSKLWHDAAIIKTAIKERRQ